MRSLTDQVEILKYFEKPSWYKDQEKINKIDIPFRINRCLEECLWYWTGILISVEWNEDQQNSGNIVEPDAIAKIAHIDAENIYRGEVYELDGREVFGFDPSLTSHLRLEWQTKDLAWRLACLIREYGLSKEQCKRLTPVELATLARKIYAMEYGVSDRFISPIVESSPASMKGLNISRNLLADIFYDLYDFFLNCVRNEFVIEDNYKDFFVAKKVRR